MPVAFNAPPFPTADAALAVGDKPTAGGAGLIARF